MSVWVVKLIGEQVDRAGGGGELTHPLNHIPHHDFLHTIRASLITDSDTDTQFSPYTDITIDSAFYSQSDLITKFKTSDKSLFLNLNVQSLNSKFEKLKSFILNLTNNGLVIDIIAMQETWTIRYPNLLSIPGFQPLIYTNRNKGRGGGVGFYIRTGLNYKIVTDLSPFHDKTLETMTLDISYTSDNHTKHFLVTSLYRSPSCQDMDRFSDKLDNLLSDLSNRNLDSYIFTDSNLNLHNIDSDQHVKNYVGTLTNSGFFITNFKSTRIHNGAFSHIDHIITNTKLETITSGTITEEISDHLITFLQPTLKKTKTKPATLKKRLYTKTNMDRFKTDLQHITWNNVLVTDNVEDCYDNFWDTYNTLHNLHFPLTTTKFNKNYHKVSDFMTTGLLISRRNKILLHKTALVTNTHDNWTTYRNYRNLFNKTIRASKKLHYESKLATNAKNPKKTWDILKELTTGKTTHNNIDKISADNQIITDRNAMAEEFNKFFASAGRKVYQSVQPTTKQPCDYIPDKDIHPLNFSNISEGLVVQTIDNMDPKTSQDASGISMKMIKFLKLELAKPLAHLFTLSVTTGVFPSKLKTSRTIPIFKAGDNTSCDNYRPISLLSSISKILEKIVACSLVDHLELNNLIYSNQYGFLRNRSTVHSLLHLTNKISRDLNDKKFVLGIFLDLRKAFDCVSHDILLAKLKKLGINDIALTWFTSYLSDRQQCVDIDGHISLPLLIDISVLQGSILGPILFLCFINDLHLSTDMLTLLFADDTIGLDSDTDIQTLINRANTELQKLANWLRANRMAANISKTKYIIFRPRGSKINIDLENNGLVYNDNEINVTNDPDKIKKLGRIYNEHPDLNERTYKFLGVYLDEYLSFDAHCTHICNKLSMSNFIINRAKNFLSTKALRTLYFSLIHPHILYCLPIYSCTTNKNINKISTLQKKAIRIITKSNYTAHTAPLFATLKILPLNLLTTLSRGLLMHSIQHKYAPASLHNTWITNSQRNIDIDLRNGHDIYIPFARTDQVKRLPYFALPTTWNELPDDRMTPNKTTFTIALKDYLHRLNNDHID